MNPMTKYAKEQALYVLDPTVIVGIISEKPLCGWVSGWVGTRFPVIKLVKIETLVSLVKIMKK